MADEHGVRGKLIALDADGVLLDYNLAYASAWKRAFGVYPKERDPEAYWAMDRWDVGRLSGSRLQDFQDVLDETFWSSLPALPGALEACTSVNLYKVLNAALQIARADSPDKALILSERQNFPTDLYIAQSLAWEFGYRLLLVDEPGQIQEHLIEGNVAVLMLTQVNYRTGYLHDMKVLTQAAHHSGALAIWDLAHSAGALPVDLGACEADFAVGCGYKYLNGGPGAPAFIWVNPLLANRFIQPLSGWMGHASPFQFTSDYQPATGISRYLCGTPPILAMAALECGVDTLLAAEPFGGMHAIRRKSVGLTHLFIDLVEARCDGLGLHLASPRLDALRGSQVSLVHAEGGYAIIQALIARGVIGDFRAPDVLRFGFTPLYTTYANVWDAVEQLRQVLVTGEWQLPRFQKRAAVT